VIAAAFATTDRSSGSTGASSAAPSPTTVAPGAPSSVRANAGAFDVKLTWRAPPEGTAISRFEIRRNGDYVGQVKGSETSFTDGDAVPRTHYTYSIAAVSADEQRSATTIRVTTKPAPPGTAALVGTFNVRLHNTSHSGFASFGSTNFNNGWRFLPQCKEPPCNTQMRNINNKKMVVTLNQKGGSYKGSASVAGLVSCQGHDVTSSVSVTIHATQADAVHDAWPFTKFARLMGYINPSSTIIDNSSASFSVTGTSLKG